MSTFAEDIEEEAKGEKIEKIIITDSRGGYEHNKEDDGDIYGVLQNWEDIRPRLDYEYNSVFGSQDCHSFYAWTATKVLYVHEYDGATSVVSVPRNPEDCGRKVNG